MEMESANAAELRIGNYVLCKGDDIDTDEPFEMECQVISLPNLLEADYFIGVEFPSETCDSFKIPLTKERMEQYGWEKRQLMKSMSEYWTKENKHTGVIYAFKLMEHLPKDHNSCGVMGVYHPAQKDVYAGTQEEPERRIDLGAELVNFAWNIKYENELQNLWFSLTNEELERQNPKEHEQK